LNLKWTKAI